ncbi:MAG: hypothetical protein AAF416_11645 [Pseudomonadota bacterium]
MSADEAAAALALTDADVERLEPLLVFARRWGVCLDWLVKGDVSGLLLDGRQNREREGRVGGSPANDPAVIAYRAYRAEWERAKPAIARSSDLVPGSPGSDDARGAEVAALDRSLKFADLAAAADAETLEGLRCQLLLVAEMAWGLSANGDPDSMAAYTSSNHGCVGSAIEMKALLSVYAAIARWIGHPSGEAAAEARSALSVEDA